MSVAGVLADNIESVLFGEAGADGAGTDTTDGKRRKRKPDLDTALLDDLEVDIDGDAAEADQLLDELTEKLVDEQDEDNADEQQSALDELDARLQAFAGEECDEEQLAMLRQTLASMPSVNKDKRREVKRARKRRRRARRALNFGLTTLVDRIDEPLFKELDWINNRTAALAVVDDDMRAHQRILRLVDPTTSVNPPRRGMRRVRKTPMSLTDVRYERWMMLSATCLYTTNVVATCDIGQQVNLLYIVNRLSGVCFNPRCFAAAKLRCQSATHLIFSGGAVVCAGANSPQMARIACIECTTILNRVGIMAEVRDFAIQNVVSTAAAGFDVDLEPLAQAYPINAHYDPYCFPGLTFRLTKGQLVFIVFKSGKCIITGVASRIDSLMAWRWFHSCILWEFEMQRATKHEDEADYRRRRRRESSIIKPMCESVRDLTVAHIGRLLDKPDAPTMVRQIYEAAGAQQDVPLSHFDDIVALGNRIGPEETIDQWLAAQDDVAELDAPLPIPVARQLSELEQALDD